MYDDNQVLWAEEQKAKTREKRDFVVDDSDIPKERVKRFEENSTIINDIGEVLKNNSETIRIRKKRAVTINTDTIFNDELWGEQWYLVGKI